VNRAIGVSFATGSACRRRWRIDPHSAARPSAVVPAAAPQRFRSALVGTLGALALVLSVVGIYGVVAYTVSRRIREIGIRLALGEAQRAIRLRIVGQALAPAALGVGVGVVAAIFAARWLESFVLGVGPRDTATLGAVSALFLSVSVFAAYAPARRASRIDPTVALRAE
jgi:putative ABC transport system permease protein